MVPQDAKVGATGMPHDKCLAQLTPSAPEITCKQMTSQLHAATGDPTQIAAETFGTKNIRNTRNQSKEAGAIGESLRKNLY